MRIQVLLFGPQAQMAGEPSIEIELAGESPTVADVLAALSQSEPALAQSLGVSRLAVNQQFAKPSDTVSPSDEIALIGMVSGG